ncbi:MAG: hypothetical protein AAGF31_01420 [Planctomycetota bacterium]
MPKLTAEQKREVCTIAAVGCDRQIAARYLGCTAAELEAAVQADGQFARDLAQAEAGAELVHMKNLKEAAQEEKNWRASVWWLERRSPDRYGRRDARAFTPIQVQRFVESLSTIIAEEVRQADDRERLLSRLDTLASEVLGDALQEPVESYGLDGDTQEDAREDLL